MAPKGKTILLIAGEASADQAAAELIRELKKVRSGWHFFGVGGKACAAEGMELIVDSGGISVVGLFEWWHKAGELLAAYRRLTRAIKTRAFDGAVLLDLPDFNLLMAPKIKRRRLPIVYYISPQVWVWRKYRIEKIRRLVDKMLVVFPFEKSFYDSHGVKAEFVGHPLLDRLGPREAYRTQAEIQAAPRIALLPGSRESELRFHAPPLKGALEILRARFPGAVFRVPVASTLSTEAVREAIGTGPELVAGRASEVLSWADVALVASGTATLETALRGTPFVLFYRTNAVSLWLFRRISRYWGFVGLPNLLHGKEVVKELIQDGATAENLAAACAELISGRELRESQARQLVECRSLLGNLGASARAAGEVLKTIEAFRAAPAESLHESAPVLT